MKIFTVTAIGLALSAAIGTAAANPLDHRYDGYNNVQSQHHRAYGGNSYRHGNDNAELLVSALLGYAIGASMNGSHYGYGQPRYYSHQGYYDGPVYQGSRYRHNAYTGYGRSDYYGNSGYYNHAYRYGRDYRNTRDQHDRDGDHRQWRDNADDVGENQR